MNKDTESTPSSSLPADDEPAGPAPAAPGGNGAKPARSPTHGETWNPIRWVRWKVVIVFAVLFALVYFLGLDSVALHGVNTAGEGSSAARWSVDDLAFGLFVGRLDLEEIFVATPRGDTEKDLSELNLEQLKEVKADEETKDKVFTASAASFDLSVSDLVRRRYVVDEVAIRLPKVDVQRRGDGSINVEDFGEAKPETGEEEAESTARDWYETVMKWYDRVRKLRERIPGSEDKGEKGPAESDGPGIDYSRGITYPYAHQPALLVHSVAASGLAVHFTEEGGKGRLAALEKGKLLVTEVSSDPALQKNPTRFELSGELDGAPVRIVGTLDLRAGIRLEFDFETGDLPAKLIEAFIGPSLSARLTEGSVALAGKVRLHNDQEILVAPKLVARGLRLEAEDPEGKIAGFDASRFVSEFNTAAEALDELVIQDMRVTGTPSAPRIEWGETVKNLILQGGKAFANKQIEKGKEILDEEVGKAQKKLEEELGQEIEALPGGDEAKKAIDALKSGLFGGGDKDKKKPD